MRKNKPFYTLTIATLLLWGAVSVAAQDAPHRWTPQPWRQYLVRLEVEHDTTSVPSIMQGHPQQQPTVDLSRFKVGSFLVPKSSSVFTGQDRWIGRENRRRGHVLGNFVTGMINTFLL